MFNSTDADGRFARAVGRLVFGVVLVGGAGVLVARLAHDEVPHAASTLGTIWSAAILAGLGAHLLARRFARNADASGLIGASFALPAAGIALVLPLTLHLPFALALGSGSRGFDEWAQISAVITGPAHITLALLAAIRASQLAHGRIAIASRRIYIVTVIVSGIPFIILWLIPPALVALTGYAFLPLLDAMPRLIARESLAPLPRAVALTS